MKKLLLSITVMVMVFLVGSVSVFAVNGNQGRNFVDADKDGICDNRGSNAGQGCNFIDADNDGVCDNRGTNVKQGRNFVDADKDGICDNRANKKVCPRDGTGQQLGKKAVKQTKKQISKKTNAKKVYQGKKHCKKQGRHNRGNCRNVCGR